MKTLKGSILLFIFAAMMQISVITALAGWQNDGIGEWYQYEDGSYPVDKAVRAHDSNTNELIIYVFDKQGYRVKDSWYQTGEGDWYLLKADGTAVLTYAVSGGNWYVFNNDTGKLICTPPSFKQIKWAIVEYEWVNGNPGSYYDVDNKCDGFFADGVSVTTCRYMINNDGIITSGFNHVTGGTQGDNVYASNGNSEEKKIVVLTDEQVFAMADQYLGFVPNPRRMSVIPTVTGYRASYLTDNGVYVVYLVRDAFTAIFTGDYNSYYCDSAGYE